MNVICNVLMRIDGIVDHCPNSVGCKETQGRGNDLLCQWVNIQGLDRRQESHGKDRAKDELRIVGEPLGERVYR
jgi:hypothetical protein